MATRVQCKANASCSQWHPSSRMLHEPCTIAHGCRLTDSPEFKNLVNVCTVLVHETNDGALLAVLESKLACRQGIGESTVEKIRELYELQERKVPVWDVMLRWARSGAATTRQVNAIERFVAWRRQCAPLLPAHRNMRSAPVHTLGCCSPVPATGVASCRVQGVQLAHARCHTRCPGALCWWSRTGASAYANRNRLHGQQSELGGAQVLSSGAEQRDRCLWTAGCTLRRSSSACQTRCC